MNDTTNTCLRLGQLPPGKSHDFAITPDAATCADIAARLGLNALRKLSFRGRAAPKGAQDWILTARLGATVVQPCVATLAPVTTRLDEDVTRTYLAEMPEPVEGEEVEMPDDDTLELLPDMLDLSQVMEEALALALPLYPRATEADMGEAVFTEPGVAPMRDEDTKPFAGLAGLKKRLEEE
ncbi:YceD family protein [Actibacterium lipolyticum]|uniref:DUF177 domain-containing protein n=1 Tax=Actibacterium lipolyticum TaxID=1524263 RepID=A0A238KG02_9RHOB|nr:DUF177 domain-containing protein [Actibacterium lipolyticum]SMX41738.1 hypothetical protein COL8621_01816 [Actibacterium lipolyticum]